MYFSVLPFAAKEPNLHSDVLRFLCKLPQYLKHTSELQKTETDILYYMMGEKTYRKIIKDN